jgi:hypothetical protein
MNASPKITPQHQERSAYVYFRQSQIGHQRQRAGRLPEPGSGRRAGAGGANPGDQRLTPGTQRNLPDKQSAIQFTRKQLDRLGNQERQAAAE